MAAQTTQQNQIARSGAKPDAVKPPAQETGEISQYRWLILFGLITAAIMEVLDTTIINVALPQMAGNLGATFQEVAWVSTGYILSNVVVLPMTAFLTATFGRRNYLTVSIIIFIIASVLCGTAHSLGEIVLWRVVQGAGGAALLSTAQATIRQIFPREQQGMVQAIFLLGIIVAPTLGPTLGGWITDNWSWPWLFLINVIPGLIAALVTPLLLPRQKTNLGELATLDGLSLVLLAAALAALMIGLKEAPHRGWLSPTCISLLLGSAAGIAWFVRRSLRSAHPVVQLATLQRRSFAIGCGLSFCLGVGLFGSVYLMPVFLAFVRRHDAFEIGTIMLVTGVAQLIAAPVAALLESRLGARWLTGAGFALFAVGLGLSAYQPRTADFDEMLWPQILRGIAIMFCLLPPTRIALGALPSSEVADASGLFNLMRNLGGAIGIALIDTILYGRSGIYAEDFRVRLLAGDLTAATAIGLDPALLANRPPGPPDEAAVAFVRPLVEKASLALCVNEAWAMLACVAVVGVLLVPFVRDRPDAQD